MSAPKELTPIQQKVADKLISTRTEAKVNRRRYVTTADGLLIPEFYSVIRPTSPIDFAKEDEFVFKLHERKPNADLFKLYVNLRNLPQEILELMAEAMSEKPFDPKPDFITGIPEAGTPIAQALSNFTGIPYISILDKANINGKRRIIASAAAERGDKSGKAKTVLYTDDLVTEADSKFEADRAGSSLGYKNAGFAVLVDREGGGVPLLESKGYQVYAPIRLTDMLAYYKNSGQITPETYQEVIEDLKKPR